jgi:hypothetical protein
MDEKRRDREKEKKLDIFTYYAGTSNPPISLPGVRLVK